MATSSLTALIAVVTVLTASSAIRLPGSNITCPPAGFDSVPDLDIFAYVSAPWYVQRQVGQKLYPRFLYIYDRV